jgi:hypothetical protein
MISLRYDTVPPTHQRENGPNGSGQLSQSPPIPSCEQVIGKSQMCRVWFHPGAFPAVANEQAGPSPHVIVTAHGTSFANE